MTSRRSRRRFLGALGAGTAGLGAGCLDTVPGIGTSAEPDPTDRTIKLGLLLGVSGQVGPIGTDVEKAARLPVEQLEAANTGFHFDVRMEDTESDPRTGVEGALKLVRSGYPAVNGALISDVTLQATQQVLIPYRTVCCSPASTSPTLSVLNDVDLVFRTVVSDALQARVLARLAADAGHEDAAVIYVNNDYGYQLTRAFSRSFRTEHGGTVSARLPYDAPSPDEFAYVGDRSSIAESEPDVVVVIGYADDGARLFEDLHESLPETDVLVTDGLQDEGLPADVDHSLDHVTGTAPLSGGPGATAFAEALEDRYDISADSTSFNAAAYDATAVLLLANAYAGRNDGEAIRAAIREVTSEPGERIAPDSLADGMALAAAGEPITYVGASSDVVFDDNGDVAAGTFAHWTFDGDSIERLDRVSL
ncbi:ABC transporter substrate-binding protein [Halovivax limisalsi]|uniref:ABC transporter substrate-binding protein n=1 Tax=Halovivax limisalsi TaxID=1453760 RepID=UPI001FFD266E|nr:ABC transporter substrate-binding protein [Halovivax limisalsi]